MLLTVAQRRPARLPGALGVLIVGMVALGMGNGAVFQLVPQRFGREIGVMTGLVGMTGGVGGFYLASSLGFAKQFTGSYRPRLPGLRGSGAVAAWSASRRCALRWRRGRRRRLAGVRV